MGVKRAVVTFELVQLRRAGFLVPERPTWRERSSRAIVIEDDLRAFLTNAEAARRHAASQPWIRVRAGIPPCTRPGTDHERQLVIANQDRPVHEVADLVNRSVFVVYGEQQRLIAKGRIGPLKERPRKPVD